MSNAHKPRPESTVALLHAILALGATTPTHVDLAERAGLSARTVDNVLKYLREHDLVQAGAPRLGARFGSVLSISLGAASCRAALVDANGDAYYTEGLPWHPNQTKLEPPELLARIVAIGQKVIARAHEEGDLLIDGRLPILGVATAWPCPVRGSKRAVGSILNAGWLSNDPPELTSAVADAFRIPRGRSHALNRANAHALAIAFDQAQARVASGASDDLREIALYVRIGGGIGFSTMILNPAHDGRLSFIDATMLGGARAMGGQLAHLPVSPEFVDELNERGKLHPGLQPLSMDWKCSCGRRGHLEALAGGTAFVERIKESAIAVPDGLLGGSGDLTELLLGLASQQELVSYALEDVGRLVGRALVAPVLLLDPNSITLSGSFAVEPVVNGLIAERDTWRHVFGDRLRISQISGDESAYLGVRGAALAVHRASVYRQLEELMATETITDELTMEWPEAQEHAALAS
jgi:predicted NBD/HSP70 family sugar kinase